MLFYIPTSIKIKYVLIQYTLNWILMIFSLLLHCAKAQTPKQNVDK